MSAQESLPNGGTIIITRDGTSYKALIDFLVSASNLTALKDAMRPLVGGTQYDQLFDIRKIEADIDEYGSALVEVI